MVISCNPDPDHELCKLIQWYLDADGYPMKERDGVIRYFVRRDGDFVWGESKEELIEKFGPKARPLSFTFISATIDDNPIMDSDNPDYRAFLEGLNPVDKARLLHGNWLVRPQGSNYVTRSMFKVTNTLPPAAKKCRAWDKASTEPSDVTRYPDFTASIGMAKDSDGNYYIYGDFHEESHDEGSNVKGKFRKNIGARDAIILKQALYDGAEVDVILPQDPGAAGAAEFRESAKKIVEAGCVCKADPMPSNKSKLTKFSPFASAVENGLVYIVENTFDKETLDAFFKELESFDGNRSTAHRKDDWPDTCATAFNYLSAKRVVQSFTLPQINAPTKYSEMKRSMN